MKDLMEGFYVVKGKSILVRGNSKYKIFIVKKSVVDIKE